MRHLSKAALTHLRAGLRHLGWQNGLTDCGRKPAENGMRERASGEINITKPRAGLLQGTPDDVGHQKDWEKYHNDINNTLQIVGTVFVLRQFSSWNN